MRSRAVILPLACCFSTARAAGRGRLARSWLAPPRSGLTFSVLLRPSDVPAVRWGWLPLLAGVATAVAVRRVAEVPARLKWPNDVVIVATAEPTGGAIDPVGYRKLAGVLVERIDDVEPAAVVGVGLNVSLRADERPVPIATSLALEGAACTDRGSLLRAVLRELAGRYADWRVAAGDSDESGLRPAYRSLSATTGRDVRVELPDGATISGRAVDVDGDGRLLVQTDDGPMHVAAGDVVHLR
jgi:BirA family biotin operon repressor/biotin-[acetyl-CoA-carboxylase] ligase